MCQHCMCTRSCTRSVEKSVEIEDYIFDIDNKSITHRPDLWGHYGLARECAVLLDIDMKNFYFRLHNGTS